MPLTDADDMWTQVTLSLRSQLAESVWFSTFQEITPVSVDESTFRLLAPSAYVRDRITTRYMPMIVDALDESGLGRREITIDVDQAAERELVDNIDTTPIETEPVESADVPVQPDAEESSERDHLLEAAGLSTDYTFDTFVKGASNQFALAAALRVAETPARSYNPLFIYGSAGLGKTHLLYAIGHYVHLNYRHHKIRYVSTETFMNEYVESIRQNTTNFLRQRYRDIDVLLIDDIQFIANKEGLQEEFFHTFNALHGANKQIVISSDRMPDAIPTLEERLRSRFKWGLITDIQPPDVETRLAILRNKAEREDVEVPGDALEFVAENISTNIRELEGALVRVMAFSSLSRQPITVDLVQQQLADLLSVSRPKIRTPEELLEEIAGILKYDVEALKGKSRQRPLVTARQEAMYVFRELTDLSYPAIARLFGGRDHTTVIHANEKIQRLMKERKQVYDQVTDLLQQLNS
jgi:chromosomal replication initiator protein